MREAAARALGHSWHAVEYTLVYITQDQEVNPVKTVVGFARYF